VILGRARYPRYNGRVRIVIALVLSIVALGCAGKRTVGGTSSAPERQTTTEEPAVAEGAPGRKETLSLEFTEVEDREGVQQVSVVMVDETGSSRRTPVNVYPGTCARIEVGDMSGELLAARCTGTDGAGFDLRFVQRRGDLIVSHGRHPLGRFADAAAEAIEDEQTRQAQSA